MFWSLISEIRVTLTSYHDCSFHMIKCTPNLQCHLKHLTQCNLRRLVLTEVSTDLIKLQCAQINYLLLPSFLGIAYALS